MNPKTTFDNINDLLKAILWPLVLVIIIMMYNRDISNMLQKSSKVSLGSFSMEMQLQAKINGEEELSKTFLKLSPPAIKYFLSMGQNKTTELVTHISKDASDDTYESYEIAPEILYIKELIDENLVSADTDIDSIMVIFNEGLSSQDNRTDAVVLLAEGISLERKKILNNSTVTLTENGEKVQNLIVDTLIRQIANPPI